MDMIYDEEGIAVTENPPPERYAPVQGKYS